MKCYMLHYHYMHWYRIPNFCNFPYSALKHHLHNIKSYFEQGLTKRINLRNTYASFIRAFHLSWKVLLYLFCFLFLFFFSCQKKKIFVSNLIEKLFSLSCNTSQEMLTYHPAWMNFDPLQSYWSLHWNSCYQSISKSEWCTCIKIYV